MTIEDIKTLVKQRIIENYTGDITAEDVNRIMTETLNHLGIAEEKVNQLASKGYKFGGVVTPNSIPLNTDMPMFYIANQVGVYSHFGGVEKTTPNKLSIIVGHTGETPTPLPIPTYEWQRKNVEVTSEGKLSITNYNNHARISFTEPVLLKAGQKIVYNGENSLSNWFRVCISPTGNIGGNDWSYLTNYNTLKFNEWTADEDVFIFVESAQDTTEQIATEVLSSRFSIENAEDYTIADETFTTTDIPTPTSYVQSTADNSSDAATEDTAQPLPTGTILKSITIYSTGTASVYGSWLFVYDDQRRYIGQYYLGKIGTEDLVVDLLPYNIVIKEGYHYGVAGYGYKWIKDLKNRFYRVKSGNLLNSGDTGKWIFSYATKVIPIVDQVWDILNVDLPSMTIDSALSSTSTNAVQNKVIKAALDGKLGDAPIDGKQYARKNGQWAEVTGGGDVPSDLNILVNSRISQYSSQGWWVDSNKWRRTTANYDAIIIPVNGGGVLVAEANPNVNTRIAFANSFDKETFVDNVTIIDGIGNWNAGVGQGKKTYNIPSTCRFLVVSSKYGGVNALPKFLSIDGVSYTNDLSKRVDDIDSISLLIDKERTTIPVVSRNAFRDSLVRSCGVAALDTDIKPLAFIHTSDIHTRAIDYGCFVNVCQYLESYDNLQFAIVTGDIVYDDYRDPMTYYDEAKTKTTKKVFNVIGNHDAGQWHVNLSSVSTDQQAYERYIAPYKSSWELGNGDAGDGKCYYYKDFDTEKIRLIVLNEFETDYEINPSDPTKLLYSREYRAMRQAQVDWLINSLSSTPNNYGVIVALHQLDKTSSTEDNNFVSEYLKGRSVANVYASSTNAEWLLRILDAFKNKTSLNFSFNQTGAVVTTINVVCDFSSNGAEFICTLCGHTHNDYIGHYQNYPSLVVLCVGSNNLTYTGKYCQRKEGTLSEDMFNVVNIDRNRKTIKVIRIGSDASITGQDRKNITIKYA